MLALKEEKVIAFIKTTVNTYDWHMANTNNQFIQQ